MQLFCKFSFYKPLIFVIYIKKFFFVFVSFLHLNSTHFTCFPFYCKSFLRNAFIRSSSYVLCNYLYERLYTVLYLFMVYEYGKIDDFNLNHHCDNDFFLCKNDFRRLYPKNVNAIKCQEISKFCSTYTVTLRLK